MLQRLKYFSLGFLVAGTFSLLLQQQQVESTSRAAMQAATDVAARLSELEDKLHQLQQQQQQKKQ